MAKAKTWFGFPKQIAYIVWNEAGERFSYYGMRSILVVFMTKELAMQAEDATGVYHLFMSANYFMPLLGGFLSDRFWGKYRTIFWLSILYCVGHGVLAAFETRNGLYLGLALIALGSGGIKPCVSAFVGDQFTEHNKHLLPRVYDLFYFSVNFGAFFSTLLIPWTRNRYGAGVAFAIPGVLMLLATVILWMGRRYYVDVPPIGKKHPTHFFAILVAAATKGWNSAKKKYGSEKTDGVQAVLSLFVVMIPVCAFWALYDQTGSTWVLQAQKMDLNFMGIAIDAAMTQASNPILVMLLIPFLSGVVYPLWERSGIKITALRRIGVGIAMSGVSFLCVGFIEILLDRGMQLNVMWQLIPMVLLVVGEILVMITGLEFAYTQAPTYLKGIVMSLWLSTVALGNLLTAFVAKLNPFDRPAEQFLFFAALALVVTVLFAGIARVYRVRSYLA